MVRMLCNRSASLTRMTRMSRAIAISILRKFSACASARLSKVRWVSLLTPSTSSAISSPNSTAIWGLAVGVSSMTSWRSAATIVPWSRRISARIFATCTGWWM